MKTATLTWVDGMRFVADADSGHSLVIDAGEAEGGRNLGTRPMELVLQALAGCTAMDVVSILRKKRQPLSHFRIVVEGERAENHPRVYTHIRMVYEVGGNGISEKAVRDAVELSQSKYCSVSAMLRATAKLDYEIRFITPESDG